MALNKGTINPLNVLGVRKLNFIPVHFARTFSSNLGAMYSIDEWIYTNLNSRYCIKRTHKLDSANKLTEVCEIGLEDPREITMLTLACPYLLEKN